MIRSYHIPFTNLLHLDISTTHFISIHLLLSVSLPRFWLVTDITQFRICQSHTYVRTAMPCFCTAERDKINVLSSFILEVKLSAGLKVVGFKKL